MGDHLIDGEFQSDKYPTTPRGKVPLSVKDPMAQDLLWEYAQRRRSVDAEFSDDLETAIRSHGFDPTTLRPHDGTVADAWNSFRDEAKVSDPALVASVQTGFSIGAATVASRLELMALRGNASAGEIAKVAGDLFRQSRNLLMAAIAAAAGVTR